MINPMVIGSGMKNKVLEALLSAWPSCRPGHGRVSDAVDGTHYIGASTPEALARAIITW
jgi:hypothetical protein